MSGEIVEESSRPLLSQRLSRSPLGAKENSAAIRLFINSQTCVGIVEEKYSSWSAVSKYISLSSGSCVLQFVNAQFLKSNLSKQDLRMHARFAQKLASSQKSQIYIVCQFSKF